MTPRPLRLCYITDRHGLAPQPILSRIQDTAQAGVDLIQLREKDMPTRELAAFAEAALQCARGTLARIVVNDRLDVAIGAGADGVHLGGQSLAPEVVRRQVGQNFLIGVSCHSLDEAVRAGANGADYILLGPIFETPSKIAYGSPLGLEKLSEVARKVKIPVIALGGITVERVKVCVAAGATGIAGIRLFQNCPSLKDRVQELREKFDS